MPILISEFHRFYKEKGLTSELVQKFQTIIFNYYKKHGRKFPFREKVTPYNVVVSEIMLQQTQTSQVSEKFLNFVANFPDFRELANAPLKSVICAWQGLGYNRRAIALHKIAEIIVKEYNGVLPSDLEVLKSFPQIGYNTASSILAFAFNMKTYFIETNIRRVFIYFFFPNKKEIGDKEIMPLVKETMVEFNPREWYYALMDYGVMLKKTHPELTKRSKHYRKQQPFKGSTRQLRGKILKKMLQKAEITQIELSKELRVELDKLKIILNDLQKEGFIDLLGDKVTFSKS